MVKWLREQPIAAYFSKFISLFSISPTLQGGKSYVLPSFKHLHWYGSWCDINSWTSRRWVSVFRLLFTAFCWWSIQHVCHHGHAFVWCLLILHCCMVRIFFSWNYFHIKLHCLLHNHRYVNEVKPGEYGIPKKIYFPFQISYWTGKPFKFFFKTKVWIFHT